MNKKAVYGLLLAIVIPLICYLIVREYSAETVAMPRHYIFDSITSKTVNGKLQTDTAWHRLPDFTLTNQLNRKVQLNELDGKILVADFFFTHCPTICPQLTKNMKMLQDNIKGGQKVGDNSADFVHFLSFSVDPERDSAVALKKWADRFQINPENWWLLTGEKKTIYDLSIDHMKLGLIDGKGIDTGFFHTDYMVLIDRNRNIRGYYHGLDTTAVARLSRDIVLLSLEKDPNRKTAFTGKFELLAVVLLVALVGLGLFMFLLKKLR